MTRLNQTGVTVPAGVSGGQFAAGPGNTEALDGLLEVSELYPAETIPVAVHDEYAEIAVVNHFGGDIHITAEPDPLLEKFQVWGDPIAVEFWREDDTPYSLTWVKYAAAVAYDDALIARMTTWAKENPAMADALNAEIDAVHARRSKLTGLTQPDGWEGDYELTAASSRIGERLECGETLTNPDSVNARCDYAEVDEGGISYGMNMAPAFYTEIVGGERLDGEADDEYNVRAFNELPQGALDAFFEEHYGAAVFDQGDYGDFSIEFFVEYGPEGAAGTSVEAMGDRAETETKLLAAHNEWMYGGSMQDKFAEAIGYRSEGVFDENGGWAGHRWVKEEEEVSA